MSSKWKYEAYIQWAEIKSHLILAQLISYERKSGAYININKIIFYFCMLANSNQCSTIEQVLSIVQDQLCNRVPLPN